MDVYRSAFCKFEILDHPSITAKEQKEMLAYAQEAARKLYNFVRHCATSYNRKLAYARECKEFVVLTDKETKKRKGVYCLPSMKGKYPKYPGGFGMGKALNDTEEYKALGDRCASYVVRGFDASMRSWFSNLKENPRARPPGYAEEPPPLTFEVGRNAKIYDDGVVRLSVLPGHIKKRFIYGKIYLPPLTCLDRVESIKILKDGRCIPVYKLTTKENNICGYAAIDLGINRMVTIAFDNGDSIMYTGAGYLSIERLHKKSEAKCKPSGYAGKGDGDHKKSSRKKKRLQDKRNKITGAILHSMTKSVVDECKKRGVGTIILGDLRGIRKDKNHGKKQNQKLHAWPFAKISNMIAYKAEEVGIKVVKISERNTSRTCFLCGTISKSSRDGRTYKCKACGCEIHADLNGALNILEKYLSEKCYSIVVDGKKDCYSFDKKIDPVQVGRFDLKVGSVKLTSTGCKPLPTSLSFLPRQEFDECGYDDLFFDSCNDDACVGKQLEFAIV